MQSTRTAEGTRAVGLLASVIETGRKRHILPWPYLALMLAGRRKDAKSTHLTACLRRQTDLLGFGAVGSTVTF